MEKKKWFLPVLIFAVIVLLIATSVGIMAGKGFGISVGRYLEPTEGTHMIILDNSPIRMSDRTNSDLFDDLDTGDKILVVHDGIAETYPGKTGAYAVFKLSEGTTGDIPQTVVNELIGLGWFASEEVPGSTLVEADFEIAVSYANWTEAGEVYFGALNHDKMAISSVKHLPIYKFDTLEDLEQFKLSFDGVLTMDSGYDEVPSFNTVTAKYDKAFFEENTLMLVYVDANSGTYRFGVDSVFCDGAAFCIHVVQTNHPEVATMDMAGWFITAAVPDSMVANCTEFDADLNNHRS